MPRKSRPYMTAGRWRFVHRGKKSRRFHTESEAWAALYELQGTDQRPTPVTVSELVNRYLDERQAVRGSPATHAAEMLEEFAEWADGRRTRLRHVQATILHDYLGALRARRGRRRHGPKRPLGPETIRKKLRYASAVLTWGHRRGLVPVAPEVPRVPRPPFQPKALQPSELRRLLVDLSAAPRCRHVVALVRFLLETGLRPGEARLLRWPDVDLARSLVVLIQPKTGTLKRVPLSATALEILVGCRNDTPHVFLSYRGKPYTAAGFGTIMRRHGCPVYRLRHTWAQHAIEAGVPRDVAREIMGHVNSAMLDHYVKIHDSQLREAAASVDGLSLPPPSADQTHRPTRRAPRARTTNPSQPGSSSERRKQRE